MLKAKIAKTGLLGHGLLLLVPNMAALKSKPGMSPDLTVATSHQLHRRAVADTSIVYAAVQIAEVPIPPSPPARQVPAPVITMNKYATKAVKSFLKEEAESLEKIKKRSASYFQTIEKIFIQYGLPVQLKYLAVVESELQSKAVSHVGAKGVWQFMPQTGRDFGLKVNGKVDERKHFYKSTVAAAKYLRALYSYFDDWLLVIAAYNSGEGSVQRAIKKADTRNFWALQRYLPAESRSHVKHFIGTHYYFEGEGSIVTMTKGEVNAYTKALERYIAARSLEGDTPMREAAGTVLQ